LVEGLTKTKVYPPQKNKRELLLSDCLCGGHQFFLAFRYEMKHWLFLPLKAPGLWAGSIPSAK